MSVIAKEGSVVTPFIIEDITNFKALPDERLKLFLVAMREQFFKEKTPEKFDDLIKKLSAMHPNITAIVKSLEEPVAIKPLGQGSYIKIGRTKGSELAAAILDKLKADYLTTRREQTLKELKLAKKEEQEVVSEVPESDDEEQFVLSDEVEYKLKTETDTIAKTLTTCRERYKAPANCKEFLKHLIWRIVNMIKAIFCRSDWQKAQKVLLELGSLQASHASFHLPGEFKLDRAAASILLKRLVSLDNGNAGPIIGDIESLLNYPSVATAMSASLPHFIKVRELFIPWIKENPAALKEVWDWSLDYRNLLTDGPTGKELLKAKCTSFYKLFDTEAFSTFKTELEEANLLADPDHLVPEEAETLLSFVEELTLAHLKKAKEFAKESDLDNLPSEEDLNQEDFQELTSVPVEVANNWIKQNKQLMELINRLKTTEELKEFEQSELRRAMTELNALMEAEKRKELLSISQEIESKVLSALGFPATSATPMDAKLQATSPEQLKAALTLLKTKRDALNLLSTDEEIKNWAEKDEDFGQIFTLMTALGETVSKGSIVQTEKPIPIDQSTPKEALVFIVEQIFSKVSTAFGVPDLFLHLIKEQIRTLILEPLSQSSDNELELELVKYRKKQSELNALTTPDQIKTWAEQDEIVGPLASQLAPLFSQGNPDQIAAQLAHFYGAPAAPTAPIIATSPNAQDIKKEILSIFNGIAFKVLSAAEIPEAFSQIIASKLCILIGNNLSNIPADKLPNALFGYKKIQTQLNSLTSPEEIKDWGEKDELFKEVLAVFTPLFAQGKDHFEEEIIQALALLAPTPPQTTESEDEFQDAMTGDERSEEDDYYN